MRIHTFRALFIVLLFAACACAQSAWAAKPAAKPISKGEHWYDFMFHGKKVGFMTATEEPTDYEGRPALHAAQRSVIVVRRQDNVIRMEATTDVWSDLDGKPIRFKHVRDEGGAARTVDGNKNGDNFEIRIDVGGTLSTKTVPLTPGMMLSTSLSMLFNNGAAPGKTQKGQAIIEEDGSVGDYTIAATGTEKTPKGDALVVVSSVSGVESKEWVIKGVTVRTVVDRLGAEFIETSREDALKLAEAEDIFTAARFLTHVQLPRGDEVDELVVRLSGKSGKTPKPLIDGRQKAANKAMNRLELRIKVDAAPGSAIKFPEKSPKVSKFLIETPYESIRDERLISAAKGAVGDAKDAWTAARRINAFVFKHIRDKTLAKAFSTAIEALESKEGDCTEHSVLFSALAKTVGIPTRLVTGLVYVGGPEGVFGYHEWVEVWMGDRWIMMDPTFGQDIADPTHIKFTQGLSDADGLREAGVAAAELFGDMQLEVLEYTTASGEKKKL